MTLGFGGWEGQLAQGAAMTLGLAIVTLPIGLAIGVGVALAKVYGAPVVRFAGEGYTTVFRGIPELLTLLLIYYGAQILLQKIAAATGLPIAIDIPPFAAGVVALALVFGAYSSEVLGSALSNVERGQIEAARSFGLTAQAVFIRVVTPQALRIALPGLGNNWLVLLKDTSLVSVIALNDLLHRTEMAVQSTQRPFQFYAAACGIYLVMTAASTAGIARLERFANRGVKAST